MCTEFLAGEGEENPAKYLIQQSWDFFQQFSMHVKMSVSRKAFVFIHIARGKQ